MSLVMSAIGRRERQRLADLAPPRPLTPSRSSAFRRCSVTSDVLVLPSVTIPPLHREQFGCAGRGMAAGVPVVGPIRALSLK
jgi:hypothetical protein